MRKNEVFLIKKEIRWRFFLNKITGLDANELKAINFFEILANGSNCLYLPNQQFLIHAGISTDSKQRKVLQKLYNRFIILPVNPETNNYIAKHICPGCSREKTGECRSKKSNLFINKNTNDWILKYKTTLSDNEITSALYKNKCAHLVDDGAISVDKKIIQLKKFEEKINQSEPSENLMRYFKKFQAQENLEGIV